MRYALNLTNKIMKHIEKIEENFAKGSIGATFVECFLKSTRTINYDSYLDYSYNRNIVISSDYGGEDSFATHFVYTITVSTFKPAMDWIHHVESEFIKLGYNKAPQYKEINKDSESGKFIDFINISKPKFKGFTVSLAVPKEIECLFFKNLADQLEHIKKESGIENFNLSEKNTEKAIRIGTLISLVLSQLSFYENNGEYFWISDKDSIAKINASENFFEYTVKLQQNLLANIIEDKMPENVGYSLPWENEEENRSYILIALNDIISGAFSEILKYPILEEKTTPNVKSQAILHASEEIPKFFFLIQKSEEGIQCKRLNISVNKLE